MNNAFFITASELAQAGFENIPDELQSAKHLIYSSPATLAFNSPGAQGFGVKRAGLAIPGSVMLLVSPGCCGRNTTLQSRLCGYQDRFFYLLLDDTDIVTGRHLTKIPEAVREVYEFCEKKPSAVMICITCVDALLGTDMDRVSRKCEELAGVPVVPCYMYALTREKKLPPMAAVRKAVYSLLKPRKRVSADMNILGFFSPLNDDSEIYELLKGAGIKNIREISRCETFEEYEKMSQANFNLVLNSEARYAAQQMEETLGIPYIEMMRMYHIDKIHNQYMSLANAIGAKFDDAEHYNGTKKVIDDFKTRYGELNFAIGEFLNADSFELAWALLSYGFGVSEIYGTVGERNFVFVKAIAKLSPQTKIFSNLSPTMLDYEPSGKKIDICIGNDAGYYHADVPAVDWNEERQPFGYAGVRLLFKKLDEALKGAGK
ncbi:MAG: oxidoreductase [Ruminococcus sp.]|nr:oxidoreductase [Ruminococcus sp.]